MSEHFAPPERSGDRYCFVCGPDNPKGLHLEFFRTEEDTVTSTFHPPMEWSGWEGLMHGGLQCVLLDEITAQALTRLAGRAYFLTTGLEVKYRKPVRLNQRLTLMGRILSRTERGSRVLGQILNDDGEVLSEAEARIVHVDSERFHAILDKAP